MNTKRVMKFTVRRRGAEQDVELGWLSRITNAAELLRAATLQVGESTTLEGNSSRLRPDGLFHVRRMS
jgi:hypothetical protein